MTLKGAWLLGGGTGSVPKAFLGCRERIPLFET